MERLWQEGSQAWLLPGPQALDWWGQALLMQFCFPSTDTQLLGDFPFSIKELWHLYSKCFDHIRVGLFPDLSLSSLWQYHTLFSNVALY